MIRTKADEETTTIGEAPAFLRTQMTSSFLRVGPQSAAAVAMAALAGRTEAQVDIEKTHDLIEVCDAGTDGPSKVIAYKLREKANEKNVSEFKLWYDPKTFKVLKRSMVASAAGNETRFVETYDAFELDVPAADILFKIPDTKK